MDLQYREMQCCRDEQRKKCQNIIMKAGSRLTVNENAKKEIEDDIVVTDTDDSSIEAQKEETK